MSRIIIIIILIIALGLYSCQKKDNTAPDATKVVFNITSPAAGQIYHKGDSVHVKANITYTGELHGYEVKVTDTASGEILYDDAQQIHNDHFDITDAFSETGIKALGLKLTLTVKLDDNGDVATNTVNFLYQP